MHETGLMNGLMKQIAEVAREHGATKVTAVRLALGALAPITDAHLREHFDLAAQGTVAEGAALEIERMEDPTAPDAMHFRMTGLDVELA